MWMAQPILGMICYSLQWTRLDLNSGTSQWSPAMCISDGQWIKGIPASSVQFLFGELWQKRENSRVLEMRSRELSLQRLCEVIRTIATWRLRICLQSFINMRSLPWHSRCFGKYEGSYVSILSLRSPCWGGWHFCLDLYRRLARLQHHAWDLSPAVVPQGTSVHKQVGFAKAPQAAVYRECLLNCLPQQDSVLLIINSQYTELIVLSGWVQLHNCPGVVTLLPYLHITFSCSLTTIHCWFWQFFFVK